MRVAAAVAAFPFFVGAASAEPARYEIDPEHLSIVFSAGHIGYGSVWGMFLEGSGSFVFDEAARTLSDVEARIDVSSVFSDNDRRDGHLRSADFLHADEHPVATFVMTEAEAIDDTTGTVTGDLTLRGVTQPVTLDVTLNKIGPYPWGDNYVVGVTLETTIRRSEFGMTYALENDLVADEIPLVIEFEAIRQDNPS